MEITDLGKGISDEARVRVLRQLLAGPLCVCEIEDALEMPQSTLSTHLQVLRDCGLVDTEKRGRWIEYSLMPRASDLLRPLLQQLISDPESGSRMRRDDLRMRHRLMLRESGCCCLGRGALNANKGGNQMNNACECGCDCCGGQGCGCGCCGGG